MVVKMVVSQALVKLRHGPQCNRLVEALANGRGGGRSLTQDNSQWFRASWVTLIDVA